MSWIWDLGSNPRLRCYHLRYSTTELPFLMLYLNETSTHAHISIFIRTKHTRSLDKTIYAHDSVTVWGFLNWTNFLTSSKGFTPKETGVNIYLIYALQQRGFWRVVHDDHGSYSHSTKDCWIWVNGISIRIKT